MGGCWNGGVMRGRHVDGMRAEGLDNRAGDGYGSPDGGGSRAWPTSVSACVCMCYLWLSSLTLLLRFTHVRRGQESRLCPGSAGHWLCDFCIYFTLSASAHSLVEQGNYSEWLTSQGCVHLTASVMGRPLWAAGGTQECVRALMGHVVGIIPE